MGIQLSVLDTYPPRRRPTFPKWGWFRGEIKGVMRNRGDLGVKWNNRVISCVLSPGNRKISFFSQNYKITSKNLTFCNIPRNSSDKHFARINWIFACPRRQLTTPRARCVGHQRRISIHFRCTINVVGRRLHFSENLLLRRAYITYVYVKMCIKILIFWGIRYR